jgi:hypothetical protein
MATAVTCPLLGMLVLIQNSPQTGRVRHGQGERQSRRVGMHGGRPASGA